MAKNERINVHFNDDFKKIIEGFQRQHMNEIADYIGNTFIKFFN